MKTLSEEQEAAVTSQAQTTYVVAGPGSGKSHTIIARVQRLVAAGADPRRIVLLTFTNAGAHVFKERLAAVGITVGFAGTLHAYCLRLIQAHGGAIGYQAGRVSLIAEEERDEMLEEVRKTLAPKLKKTALNPRRGTVLSAAEEFDAALVLKAFARKLKLSNCIDYDGVLEVGRALLDLPAVAQAIAFDELLGDEVQDSGRTDWGIYDALPCGSRFFCGDPDQSIFGFRGARPELFTDRVQKSLTGESLDLVYTLQTDYRSGPAICDAANNLIRHNGGRVEKWCIAAPGAPADQVYTISAPNDVAELEMIRGMMLRHAGEGTPYTEMAVLARTNALAKGIRQKLREAGIPVKEPVYAEMPHDWRLCMALIAGMYSPANPIVSERLLRAMGKEPAQIATWRREADARGVTLCAVAGILQFAPPNLETLPAALVVERISPASVAIVRERIALLPQSDPSVGDLLQDLWVHESWSADEEGEGVHVGTIHSIKGREFECVIVAGCEEGELPGKHDIEEFRRLMFVAVTRAKRFLYLTSVSSRWKYGKAEACEPSRFIAECGL